MTRLRGRLPRGRPCAGSPPYGHWKTTNFIAGSRHDTIFAPLVLGGPMNGAAFLAYIETCLCPTLRPGNIAVADNLSFHKVAGDRGAIEAVGATLRYLPGCSPDPHPIEKMFSKLKALLRNAAKRTVEALWAETGRVLDMFTPRECSDYFASCGYVNE
jgi:transposase